MVFKVTCYGVRPNEVSFFNKLNKYGYDLHLVEALTTHDNVEEAEGSDAVILRGNCVADRKNLEKFASWGIKYVFTRTAGVNHIDKEAAKELGLKVANVPSYSPNAIAELSLTLAMNLLRHLSYTVNKTSHLNFKVDEECFQKRFAIAMLELSGQAVLVLQKLNFLRDLVQLSTAMIYFSLTTPNL